MEGKTMAFGNNKGDYVLAAQTGFGAHPEIRKTKSDQELTKKTPPNLSPKKIDQMWGNGKPPGFLWDPEN